MYKYSLSNNVLFFHVFEMGTLKYIYKCKGNKNIWNTKLFNNNYINIP